MTHATATQSYTIDIPSKIGGAEAYIGFTGGTGSYSAVQKIITWSYASGTPTPLPTISPVVAAVTSPTVITINDAVSSANIYYTLDGSVPTASSNLYNGPFSINTSTTVNAVAILTGNTSAVASAVYRITTPTIDFSSGFVPGYMSLNGSAQFGNQNGVNPKYLYLTQCCVVNRAASAFYFAPVGIRSFSTDFTFQLTYPFSNGNMGDGFMFVLQNQGISALGGYGQFLGFGGITKSVGIKFDLYNNAGEGNNSTGLFTNGAWPTSPSTDLTSSGVNLRSRHVMQAHMGYKGTTLTVKITDTVTKAFATQIYTVDLPAIVGADTAYVGFTGGTGGAQAVQFIQNWSYNAQ